MDNCLNNYVDNYKGNYMDESMGNYLGSYMDNDMDNYMENSRSSYMDNGMGNYMDNFMVCWMASWITIKGSLIWSLHGSNVFTKEVCHCVEPRKVFDCVESSHQCFERFVHKSRSRKKMKNRPNSDFGTKLSEAFSESSVVRKVASWLSLMLDVSFATTSVDLLFYINYVERCFWDI